MGIKYGSWKVAELFRGERIIRPSGGGYALAAVYAQPDKSGKPIYDRDANANLIAAAPDLLEACDALIDFAIWMSGSSSFSPGGEAHEGWMHLHSVLDKGKAAIAQARGETDRTLPIS